jgi:hypothetical protein
MEEWDRYNNKNEIMTRDLMGISQELSIELRYIARRETVEIAFLISLMVAF